MEAPTSTETTERMRIAAGRTIERLGAHRLVVAEDWQSFADACDLPATNTLEDPAVAPTVAPLVVGTIRHVLDELDGAEPIGRVGFVVMAARPSTRLIDRLLRRKQEWIVDPTQKLWAAGWSPLAVERIEVVSGRAALEVVIGDARPRPESLVGRSAFDDPN